MTWTQTTQGTYELVSTATAQREAFVATSRMVSGTQARFQITDPDENLEMLIRSSPDGRTGWMVYTDGTNLRIRRITFGTPAAQVATATYAAAGLTAAQPATIDVRVNAGTISVYVNENETAALTYAAGTNLAQNDRWGFSGSTSGIASQVDGTMISADLCELVPVVEERTDVLVAIAGGECWAAVDETNITRIAAGVMLSSGDVAMTDYDQKMYMVDGKHAKIFDSTTMLVTDWVPTTGTLPGQTDDGTTTATLIETHFDRLYLAGAQDDPQNLWASAIGDAMDFDTTSVTRGRSFILSAERSGRVGQPILALLSSSAGTLIIGTTGEIWEWRGDFTLGQPLLHRMSKEGVSGKDSMYLIESGKVLVHGPSGLLQLQEGIVGSVNLSRPVLTSFVQYPTRDRGLKNVQVVRDTQRHGVFIALTNRDASQATHIWYDERVAGFGNLGEVGRIGGFFPWQLPLSMGPTASVVWKGRPVYGTTNGLIVQADETTRHDDFTAVSCRIPTALFVSDTPDHEVLLEAFLAEFAPGGQDIQLRVWGGATAEDVYDSTKRIQLLRKVVGQPMNRTYERVRAPALYVEMEHELALGSFRIEGCYAQAISTRLARRWGSRTALVPADPALPPNRVYPQSGSGSPGSPVASGPGPGISGSPSNPSGSVLSGPGGSPVPSGSLASGSFPVSGSVGFGPASGGTTGTGDGPTFEFYTGGETQD